MKRSVMHTVFQYSLLPPSSMRAMMDASGGTMKIYIDGEYYEKNEAKISVYDHGLLYGDGVFEGIRIYKSVIFRLEEHIERLYRGAQAILLDIPMDKERMIDTVKEAVAKNDKRDGYIRLLVTRGPGPLGIDPYQCPKPSVIIIVDDIKLYPEEYYDKGISLVTAATRRTGAECLDPRIKSLNYLNNIIAKIEARQAGCLEAVMLNRDGFVAECTADNIFIVKDGVLYTPEPTMGALDGITRDFVIELAGEMGRECRYTAIARYDLYNSDECFLTGTGAEILPVVMIDGRTIGRGNPGPVTAELKKAFDEEIARLRLKS